MILPIVAYGDPVLRKVGVDIDKDYPNLSELIDNMRETMENAQGVGLAAPQIDKSIRLFLVNTAPFGEDEDLEEEERTFLSNFNKVFINAKILKEEGAKGLYKGAMIRMMYLSVGGFAFFGIYEQLKK